MLRSRTRLIFGALSCLGLGACSSIERPAAQSPGQALQKAPSALGYVEHRGRRYDLRNLMDPAYRAASDDPFVRGFSPETALADRAQSRASLEAGRTTSGVFSALDHAAR
jgi:hypothetical protein